MRNGYIIDTLTFVDNRELVESRTEVIEIF